MNCLRKGKGRLLGQEANGSAARVSAPRPRFQQGEGVGVGEGKGASPEGAAHLWVVPAEVDWLQGGEPLQALGAVHLCHSVLEAPI